jgi:hypothetical protein
MLNLDSLNQDQVVTGVPVVENRIIPMSCGSIFCIATCVVLGVAVVGGISYGIYAAIEDNHE